MASGDLVVSVFSDYLLMEMFVTKGKKRKLVQKYYEKYSLPLNDMNKVDLMDFEKIIYTFIQKTNIKRGKVHIVLFGKQEDMPYYKFDFGTANKISIRKMLPLEIEELGDEYLDFDYKYDIVGSDVRTYFIRKELINHLSNLKIRGSWELITVIPGYITYQGMVPEDGMVLDINESYYNLYVFRKGLIDTIEVGDIYNHSLDEGGTDVNTLVNIVEEDVTQFINKYNFTNGTEIDLVYVVNNDNREEEFIAKDVDGVYFDKVKDLRKVFDTNIEINKSVSNAKLKKHSDVSLGFFYEIKNLKGYNFAPEKLEIKYKNILTTSIAFSLALVTVLPLTSMYVDTTLDTITQEVQSYESNLNQLTVLAENIENQIIDNDNKIKDYNEYVRSLEKLNNQEDNFISGVLAYLPSNTPSSIIFNSMRLEQGSRTLIIQGKSRNYKDIGSFAIELEEFGRVSINSIEENDLENEEGYPFELELRSN